MKVVIPCVNYSDFLAITLPEWRKILPTADIVVVTDLYDSKTQVCAIKNHVRVITTDAWYRGDAVLDKASALNFGFNFKQIKTGEWCLSLDADSYPIIHSQMFVPQNPAHKTLYGARRYECRTQEEFEQFKFGEKKLEDFPESSFPPNIRITNFPALGYFQLWQYEKGDHFDSCPTASEYDLKFMEKFSSMKCVSGISLLHLGIPGVNWNGRKTEAWGDICH